MSKRKRKIYGLATASENRVNIDYRIAELKKLGISPKSKAEIIEACVLLGSTAYADAEDPEALQAEVNAYGHALLWVLGIKKHQLGHDLENPIEDLLVRIRRQNGLDLKLL